MADYKLITIWRINAPIETAWNAIYHSELWPVWWCGVESVIEIQKGDKQGVGSIRRYVWKSILPYRLTFDAQTVRVDPPFLLKGLTTGELAGTGLWQLSQEGCETVIRYYWNIQTTQRWMQWLEPIARPLFIWNHNIIMHRGAEGLAKRLGVSVTEYWPPGE